MTQQLLPTYPREYHDVVIASKCRGEKKLFVGKASDRRSEMMFANCGRAQGIEVRQTPSVDASLSREGLNGSIISSKLSGAFLGRAFRSGEDHYAATTNIGQKSDRAVGKVAATLQPRHVLRVLSGEGWC